MAAVNESIIKFGSRNGTLLSIVLLHPKWQANILYYLHFLLYFVYFKQHVAKRLILRVLLCSSLIFSTVTEVMTPPLFFSD